MKSSVLLSSHLGIKLPGDDSSDPEKMFLLCHPVPEGGNS